MPKKTRLFICYKKKGPDGADNSAYQLGKFLGKVSDYDVWMDEVMQPGIEWEKTIYEKLLSTDVVIVGVGNGTSQSEWVKRELSLAMAFGIQIVPVGLGISEDQLHQEVKNLGLPKLHYRRPFDIDSLTAEAIVPQLAKPIEQARTSTKKNGREFLKSIINNLESELKPPPAKPPTLSAARKEWTFGTKKLCLHIAAGDIFELSDYDILVNSENDYMQMARPFDMATISSRIRYLGGLTEKGFHDTIQSEIDKLIAGQSRPLPAGTAIPTSSGGPDSILYDDQGISHVIHVAAVRGDPDRRRIAPLIDDHLIRRCVTKALLAAQTICQNTGVISPEGTPQRDLQERKRQALHRGISFFHYSALDAAD